MAGSSLLQLMDRFAFSSHILQLTNRSDDVTELESNEIGKLIIFFIISNYTPGGKMLCN